MLKVGCTIDGEGPIEQLLRDHNVPADVSDSAL
jgi:hypothetical protein